MQMPSHNMLECIMEAVKMFATTKTKFGLI
jgi:hypothetical protein